jgi:hypothetical protein
MSQKLWDSSAYRWGFFLPHYRVVAASDSVRACPNWSSAQPQLHCLPPLRRQKAV